MEKGRKSMYDIMLKDKKSREFYKEFYWQVPDNNSGDLKFLISSKVTKSVSQDMQRMMAYMTASILKGLLNDRE